MPIEQNKQTVKKYSFFHIFLP